MENKRIFLALPVEPVAAIVELASQLKGQLCSYRIKWEEASKYHLTLFFFGQVPAFQLSVIQETLCERLRSEAAFDFSLGGAGLFKTGKEPRVLWLGLDMPESFVRLKERIDQAMANLGFLSDSKPFRPHLTLGRFSAGQLVSPGLNEMLSTLQPPASVHFQASRLILFESRLSAAGSRYFPVEEYKLKQPAEKLIIP